MKSAQEWALIWMKGTATDTIKEHIERIQKDAFESGRVAGLIEASEFVKGTESWTDIQDHADTIRRLSKDTTCSKNTP